MKNYLFALGTLKGDIRLLNEDENDSVLKHFETEYKIIEEKLPVILALGNKDLKFLHWKEIYEKMNCGI
jgi:hypothetical protein